jgi:carbon-monoxide dehydrogenase small subunit
MAVVKLTVNGLSCTAIVEEGRVTLLELLRDGLGLTGTKQGCGVGQCGACTVVMNGEAVTSCTVPARKAEGAEILTIEGLADGYHLHPLQQAFLDAGAVQCGFCTPGLIMRAYALLTARPKASKQEILASLDRHICRCTGYESILAAVLQAQKAMRAP